MLYVRVETLERSKRSVDPPHDLTKNGSPGNTELYRALVEYELRRVTDGASYSIGSARGEESDSSSEAILDAINWVPNKVAADLRNLSGEDIISSGVTESGEESASRLNENANAGENSCAWLPKNIPHAEALRGVCERAVIQPEKMPNLICQQETARYLGHRAVPIDLITATIRYADGGETFSDLKRNGRPLPGAWWNSVGLWSSGQFEGNLSAIFEARNRAVFTFSGETRTGTQAAWVFLYQIARQYEPLWELRAEDQVAAPPYGGEVWVDEKTGDVLHFRSTAKEFSSRFPLRGAEIATDYADVVFPDGTSFLLPVKSTVDTRYRQEPPKRNVVEFHGCHKFRATARMLQDIPAGVTDPAYTAAATSAELEAELNENETLYAIMREETIAEDEAQSEFEQQQELRSATGEVFWKMAQLVKQQEKAAVASRRNDRPDSKFEITSTSNGVTTFKVNVKLVPVSIVVRDTKGRAVGNLKQDDFQLFDKNKPQEIVSFSVEKAPGTQGIKERAPVIGDSKPEGVRNYVAYVFDDLHTAAADLARAKAAAGRHLAEMRPADRVAIVAASGEIGLDFTDDHEKLQAALQKIRPHSSAGAADCPPMDYYTADAIVNGGDASALESEMEDGLDCTFGDARVSPSVRGPYQQAGELEKARRLVLARAVEVANVGKMESDRTLATLHEVMERAATMPGRRSIVLLSPGFQTVSREQQKGAMYLIERALRAGVVFNTLDVRGLSGNGLSTSSNHINATTEKRVLSTQADSAQAGVMADFAYGTGGTFFHNNNDLEIGLRRTADPPEFVYVLGFSPQRLDGKFHKLKVKVNQSEKLTVQARQGYYALRAPSVQ